MTIGCNSVDEETDDNQFENNLVNVDKIVIDELNHLSISTASNAIVQEITLPVEFNDANWGLKAIMCKDGGYDLTPFAGQVVNLTSVNIDGTCSGEEITIWIVSTSEQIAGAYISVREDSHLVPGIWPANADNCQY